MKRIICILILLSLLCIPTVLTLAACGNGESAVTTAPRSAEATTASPTDDDLPDDLDFGGLSIRFALSEAQNGKFQNALSASRITKRTSSTRRCTHATWRYCVASDLKLR